LEIGAGQLSWAIVRKKTRFGTPYAALEGKPKGVRVNAGRLVRL
jgi:hypothetical protein